MADKAGIYKDTGFLINGLEDYLKEIYPNTNDWIHDKALGRINGLLYRSEDMKLIIGFDF